MGWLDFIASIVGSLAWPAAVFGSVVLFRRELIPLLPRLRVKHKDTEVSFRLEEARKEAEQLQPPPDVQMLPSPVEQEKGSLLAELNPRAAMLDARAELEQAVREAAVRFDIEHAASRPLAYLVKELKGRLPKGLGSLLDDLRQIGNNAAHNADATTVTTYDAKNFRQLVDKAIISLQAARRPRRDLA